MDSPIIVISSLILIVYTILSTAYWSDAGRWGDKIKNLPEEERKRAKRNRKNAEKLFKLCTIFMLYTLIIAVIPFYISNNRIEEICKWLLLPPFLLLIIMFSIFLSGKYFVDID